MGPRVKTVVFRNPNLSPIEEGKSRHGQNETFLSQDDDYPF